MFCSKCGEDLGNDYKIKFCPKCGFPTDPNASVSYKVDENKSTNEETSPVLVLTKIVGGLIAVLLIAMMLLGVFE